MNRSRGIELSLVVAIGVFWGLNWPAVKFILGEIPPWTFRGFAFFVGAIALGCLAYVRGEKLKPEKGEYWPLAIAGLLTIFGFNVQTALGQLLTETSRAAIIAFTMPLWAALFSVLYLGERLTVLKLASLAVGMLGLAVLVSEGFESFLQAPLGGIFMLGAAISWAAGTVALKAREWSMPPISRAAWLVGFSAPPTILVALLFEQPLSVSDVSGPVILVLIYHIVFPMVVCYGAWVILVGRMTASSAAIGTLLIPIVGVLSAGYFLGDAMTWQKLTALALVLCSIALTFVEGSRTGAAR